nr:Hypothetical protein 2 CDS [Astacus astacus]
MAPASLPFPPNYPVRGHHSLTNRGQLVWYRALAIAVLATALVGLNTLLTDLIDAQNQDTDELIAAIRDVETLIKKNTDSVDTIARRILVLQDELLEIGASSTASTATLALIWRQFTTLLAQGAERYIEESGRDIRRNELLTSIEAAVQYDELTFRKRVRHALIGTTIISTTEYEAGGQCDIIPEECTLLGEAEAEVEDVTWL